MRVHSITKETIDGVDKIVVKMQGCKFRCITCPNPEVFSNSYINTSLSTERQICKAIEKLLVPNESNVIYFSGGETLIQADDMIKVIEYIAYTYSGTFEFEFDTTGAVDYSEFVEKLQKIQYETHSISGVYFNHNMILPSSEEIMSMVYDENNTPKFLNYKRFSPTYKFIAYFRPKTDEDDEFILDLAKKKHKDIIYQSGYSENE